MIYTVTMNPALDYVVDLPHFNIGDVNRVENEHIFFGGKGINVACVLKELGFESTCLGFTAGFTGQELQRGLKEELKLMSQMIQVNQGMTRINMKIHSQQETEINGLGPIVEKDDFEKLLQQIKNMNDEDILVLSGSVPSSLSQNVYCDLLEVIANRKIKTIVDATGQLLLDTLIYHPFLIKPNNHELAELFHTEIKNIEDIENYARKLQDMGARNVLISMAKDGALLIDENGVKHLQGVCRGEVKNSVGAGDSMVAGFIAGYLSRLDYHETLKLATAAGGATAFSNGLATQAKIYELLKQL